MVALDSAPWVEKYRPDTLDDVAAHKEIISTSTYIYIYICVCVCVCVYGKNSCVITKHCGHCVAREIPSRYPLSV